MIGRFVDVVVALDRVVVTCAGQVVADHARSWASWRLFTKPAHIVTTAGLRTAFKTRTSAARGPAAAAEVPVELRALTDYVDLFDLGSPEPTADRTADQSVQMAR